VIHYHLSYKEIFDMAVSGVFSCAFIFLIIAGRRWEKKLDKESKMDNPDYTDYSDQGKK
jgi:hypothetical protein